ncbi:MAG: hypothetical protein JWN70_6153 [Planctomycetaceae bacterium]|nr:hypothetical protein [Planctomycetaceae bacterium]
MSPTRRLTIPDEVKQAIAKVREFYRLGQGAPTGRNHGQNLIASHAKKVGLNEDTMRKARVFANPVLGYGQEELNGLIDQLETHVYSDNGWQFGRTHIVRLISIKDREGRKTLQDEVIDRELTCSELERLIRQRYGARKRAGRRRYLPRRRGELLSEIDHECDRWSRWWQTLKRIDEDTSRFDQLPKGVQAKLREVAKAIEELQKSAQLAAAKRKKPE